MVTSPCLMMTSSRAIYFLSLRSHSTLLSAVISMGCSLLLLTGKGAATGAGATVGATGAVRSLCASAGKGAQQRRAAIRIRFFILVLLGRKLDIGAVQNHFRGAGENKVAG